MHNDSPPPASKILRTALLRQLKMQAVRITGYGHTSPPSRVRPPTAAGCLQRPGPAVSWGLEL